MMDWSHVIPWPFVYAIAGALLFFVLLYIAFWTLIYALGLLGGLLVLLAGWGYMVFLIAINLWRLPWFALAFPVHCLLYLGGWRRERPRIVDKWEYGVTPRAAFGLDCVLWLMIWSPAGLVAFAYAMPELAHG